MARIVGIDLGTTNTAVAVMQDGRPRMIEDERGYKVLPSVVSARGEGRFIVGQAAASLILTHPDRTVYATKRLIGRRYDSPEVQRAKARLHYELRAAPDGGVQVKVGEEWMSPAEVAAVVLQVARTVAEKATGEPVDEAVITVPAYFNHQQRAQTMEAAHLAGLKCERLLNEPTAAALAYGHRKNVEKTLLIFDLGGGTFDVSVLKLSGGIYEILATGGDTYLGGEDFDYRLVDHLADAFQSRTGTDLRGDKGTLQRLKDAAERAKCELSFSDRTNVVVPHIIPGESLQAVLSRQTLESLTSDLVQRCVEIARQTVADAGLQLQDVDDVVLVGGQTRMPKVREAVAGVFGKEPGRTVHPEEAVAIGAAVHAQSLADPEQPHAILLDVTPFDLGIDSAGGLFTPIVNKNARIPCAETRTFATVADGQTTVRVTARQGESRTAVENEFLGEFVMEGLEARPRLQTKVDVTFRIDNNGMLAVTAVERATGKRTQINVRNYADRAQTPRMPSREESEADREARAKGLATAVAPVAAAAATTPKKGLLSSLFGGKKKKETTVAAPAVPLPTPEPVAAPVAAVEAAPPEVEPEPLRGPPVIERVPEAPRIDLSDIPVAGLEDVTDLATDAPVAGAAPLDDDDLFPMSEGPAAFGLAGGTPRPSAGSGLDPSDLFSSLGADDELDANTDRGRNPFGGDDITSPGHADDPFARPAPDPSNAQFFLPGPGAADEPAPEDGEFAMVDEETASRTDLGGLFFEGLLEPPPAAEPAPDDGSDLGELIEDESVLRSEEEMRRIAAQFDEPAGGNLFGFAEPARRAPEPERRVAPPPEPPRPAPVHDDLDLGLALDDLFDGRTHQEREPAPARPDPADLGDLFGFVEPRAPAPPPPAAPVAAPVAPVAPVAAPVAPPPVPAPDAESFFGSPDPTSASMDEAPKRKKKPARLKLHYRERDAFLAEYRDNLRRGGTFIRTDKPLSLGRECVFEIDAPGLVEPIVFSAVVSGVSSGNDGAPAGMTVEYKLDASQRDQIERVLARL